MPIYSFGKTSPLKIRISDREAAAYNRVTTAFFTAQRLYRLTYGVRWTPKKPISIDAPKQDMRRYNRVGRIISRSIQAYDGLIRQEDLPEDYLVKN